MKLDKDSESEASTSSDEEEMSMQRGGEDSDEINSRLTDTLADKEEQTNERAAKSPNLHKEKNTDTKNVVLNVTF